MVTISLGSYLFDPGVGLTGANGRVVAINQRGLAILETLLGAQGRAVTKAELLERVWPGQIVEEGNLTVQIAALRKLLGEGPDGREWIVTVPRVGYRMITTSSPTQSKKANAQVPLPEKLEREVLPSLAVLPFSNLSGDPEEDYFADGIVEDIITALSRFKSFAVIARNSSFAYKGPAIDVRQVATELGVRYILEGSVRRLGKTLRITAKLIDAVSGAQLWAEKYEGTIEDVFTFQDKIAESVIWLVEPTIQAAEIERSRRERPGSIAAYDLYLQSLSGFLIEPADENAKSYGKLSQALALEPDNALYLSRAALRLMARNINGYPSVGADDVAKCTELARRGLEHAAGDGGAMACCGIALVQTAKDYDYGMEVLRTAVAINPNDFLVVAQAGVGSLHCGEIVEALTLFHRAIRLSPGDPLASLSLTGIAHAHMAQANYEEALEWAIRSRVRSVEFDPNYWMLIAANAQLGRMAEARRFLKEYQKHAPGVTIADIKAGQPTKYPDRMANILDGLRLAGLAEAPEPEPTIPSLAVLPFENMSGDPEQEYFADGIADDIITALSRFKRFAVIARNSSFTYKGRAVDVREVAKDLGVRYVLEGSVRRAGGRLRITTQLVDGASGAHIWARNFDGALDDVFDFQDRITESVVSVVEPQIEAAELARSRRERPGSLAAYDLYLRAMPKLVSQSIADNAEAYARLEEALALEPDNALVLASSVWALGHRHAMGWPPFGPDDKGLCAARARRAVEHADGDATVMVHCGVMLVHFVRDYDVGMAMARAAVETNPNNFFVAVEAGIAALHCGTIEEALACFHRANRLSPRDPRAYFALTGIAHAHMVLGDYAEALSWATRSLAVNANFNATYWMLIAANAHLGRVGEARRHLERLKIIAPGVTVAGIRAGQPAKDPNRCAAILDGLRLAGLK